MSAFSGGVFMVLVRFQDQGGGHSQREFTVKCAAGAWFAADADLAAMQGEQFFGDEKPQANAAFGEVLLVFSAEETVKNVPLVGGGNADAAVNHIQANGIALFIYFQPHTVTGGCIVQGIFDQIVNCPLQPVTIAMNG